MKKLILVRGMPGSGKTTFATFLYQNLGEDIDVASCSADNFFEDDKGGYNFDVNLLHKAHLSCQQDVEIAMQDARKKYWEWEMGDRRHEPDSVIIVHNTFTAERELRPYLDLAEKYGYEVTSLVVENRHGNKSIHNVPEATLEKMKGRFSVKI